MIRINLLPPEVGRPTSAAAKQLAELPWKRIGIGSLGLLGLYTVWVLAAVQMQSGALARLTAQWGALQPERSRLEQTQASLRALQNRTSVIQSLKQPEAQWAPRLNLLTDVLVSNLWFTHLVFLGGSAFASSEMESALSEEAKRGLGLSESGQSSPTEPYPGMPPEMSGMPASPPAASKPILLLGGSALITAKTAGAPVSRFLQRLKESPEFSRWFTGVELKDVEHRQVHQEEVSDFAILLYPAGF